MGNIHYDEIPKELLMMVIEDEVKDEVVHLIIKNAKTGDGNFGDGKIFVSDVDEVYTISSGTNEL